MQKDLKNRRRFMKWSAVTLGSLMFAHKSSAKLNPTANGAFHMPEEGEPHKQTWMALVANGGIWSRKQLPAVKRELAYLANTIAQYEPVSILVNPADIAEAKTLLDINHSAFPINIIECPVDDLWLRDTGPTFVFDQQDNKVALDFNFNGWGNKQTHTRDKKVAGFIAKQTRAEHLITELVLEGGCFEVDGQGTAIMTKSCIFNDNRNPGWSLEELDAELKALLGLRKIIWLEGIKGKDITDGHTDFYARFIKPGHVVVSRDNYRGSFDYDITRENIKTLKASTDADGRALKLSILDTPDVINETYGVDYLAAGYIGYYLCNGAVIAQKFGDRKTDAAAKRLLQKAFPDRVVEQIAIDAIASGGGSIHCATQQEPDI